MSRRVFLDTSGWLAALSVREESHEEALDAYRGVLTAGRGFVTTNLVVAEMHVLLARQRGPVAGIQLLDALEQDPAHEVRYVTRELERQAVNRWLRPYADQRFSLTDAVSFETMRVELIREAFALDRHFQIAGFMTIPEPG
jgi:predicted nucleic acid-binding protein